MDSRDQRHNNESITSSRPTPVSTVSGDEVQVLLAKLERASPYLPNNIPYYDLSSVPKNDNRNKPPKHLLQLESMLNHLNAHGLLNNDTTYIEFGCGTAKLSDCISERLQGKASHVLIDRKSFSAERMRDGAIMARCALSTNHHQQYQHCTNKNTLKRLTMDIADFDLDSLEYCLPLNTVGVSKHLCGPAADATIRCVSTRNIPLLVATCCHYLCQLDTFCNTDFVVRELGFTEREFEILSIISGWASIKVNQSSLIPPPTHEEPFPPPLPIEPLSQKITYTSTISSDEFERTYSREEKQRLGKRCKVVLDTGRAHYLVSMGYSVQLVQYTSLSMENHLLIATPCTLPEPNKDLE